jgi:hypothetical protein
VRDLVGKRIGRVLLFSTASGCVLGKFVCYLVERNVHVAGGQNDE